jgi:hypothetical protein
MESGRTVTLEYNASGAYRAAQYGRVVLVVDVIDMSTTLEAARQQGAFLTLGASPSPCRAPVPLDPVAIGRFAGERSVSRGHQVVLIAEPRWGDEEERFRRATGVLDGLKSAGVTVDRIYPNLGAETVKLVDFRDKIVIAVTDCGGAAFDAAFNAGAPVLIGTIARTFGYTGQDNANDALRRAVYLAEKQECGLSVVASSEKAMEDVLAAKYLVNKAIIFYGFKEVCPDEDL